MSNQSGGIASVSEMLASIIENCDSADNIRILHDENGKFVIDESVLHDYKDEYPFSNSDSYFGSIIRLICAFHNTYGGVILFGVDDNSRSAGKNKVIVDSEKINRKLRETLSRELKISVRQVQTPSGAVQLLIVPIRPPACPPIYSTKKLGTYEAGKVWIRQGAEVLEAIGSDLTFLYSDRSSGFAVAELPELNIRASLPPSPATIQEFVGRFHCIEQIAHWLQTSRDPRLFLWGQGGSGKSTIAYEFASLLAEVGKAFATKQGPIERVVYLSAKAIYLDPLSAEVKTSTGTDFGDALELFQAILMLADWSSDDQVSQYDYETALNSLEELLDTETIFIVVDDIDTLTTANKDGGMEEMFLLMSRAKSGSKILYTQRNFPSFAPRAAVEVPGLDHEEAHQFIDLCCKKFSVPAPSDNEEKWIKENSEKRPLAIETMIGMRRITASYSDAFQRWKERSGDARSYLFSREYQQLNHNDRGRHLLAALSISDAPQSFGALQSVLQFTTEQLEDAIAETRDMFLSITSGNDAEGDLYSIGPATRLYVSEVSKQLDRFGAIKARVTHLRNISASTPKAFAHIIDGAARSVDAGQPEKAITMLTNPSLPDVFKEHPLVNAVLGKAYAEVHPPNVIEARACFESAFSLGHRNYQMYIDWLDLEQKNRTEVLNGLAICEKVTSANGFTPRTKATFFKRKARLDLSPDWSRI